MPEYFQPYFLCRLAGGVGVSEHWYMLAKNISDEIGALSFQILVLNPPASREKRTETTHNWEQGKLFRFINSQLWRRIQIIVFFCLPTRTAEILSLLEIRKFLLILFLQWLSDVEIGRNLISSLYQAISKINILLRLTLKTLMLIEIQIDSCKESACSSSLTPKEAIVALKVILFSVVGSYLPLRIAARLRRLKINFVH